MSCAALGAKLVDDEYKVLPQQLVPVASCPCCFICPGIGSVISATAPVAHHRIVFVAAMHEGIVGRCKEFRKGSGLEIVHKHEVITGKTQAIMPS